VCLLGLDRVAIGSATEVTIPLVHALRARALFGFSSAARLMVSSAGSFLHGTNTALDLSSACSTGSTPSPVRGFTPWPFSKFYINLRLRREWRLPGEHILIVAALFSAPFLHTRVVRGLLLPFWGVSVLRSTRRRLLVFARGILPCAGPPSLSSHSRIFSPHDAMRFVRFCLCLFTSARLHVPYTLTTSKRADQATQTRKYEEEMVLGGKRASSSCDLIC
jgi:hypothetical protein